jgi:hypothetical protein
MARQGRRVRLRSGLVQTNVVRHDGNFPSYSVIGG